MHLLQLNGSTHGLKRQALEQVSPGQLKYHPVIITLHSTFFKQRFLDELVPVICCAAAVQARSQQKRIPTNTKLTLTCSCTAQPTGPAATHISPVPLP